MFFCYLSTNVVNSFWISFYNIYYWHIVNYYFRVCYKFFYFICELIGAFIEFAIDAFVMMVCSNTRHWNNIRTKEEEIAVEKRSYQSITNLLVFGIQLLIVVLFT